MKERLSDLVAIMKEGYDALQRKPWTLFLGCFSMSFVFISVCVLIGDLLLRREEMLSGDVAAIFINAFCTALWLKDWREIVQTPIENGQRIRVWRRNRMQKEQPWM